MRVESSNSERDKVNRIDLNFIAKGYTTDTFYYI